jgi:Tol biopolymer transport system component
MLSSPLSALSMPDMMISYSFLLVGITILASVAFTTATLLPNQFSAFATVPGEDGTKLAFTSDRDVNREIYVMNAQDGSNQTRLTENPDSDEFPSWSPDGTKLAFTSDRDGNREIYVMNAQNDGSNQTNLTMNPAFDFDPTWSPDGTKLAFTSDRDGNTEIYVMNAQDGSNQTRLTDNGASDGLAEWMHSTR